jgi:hypothetical protein
MLFKFHEVLLLDFHEDLALQGLCVCNKGQGVVSHSRCLAAGSWLAVKKKGFWCHHQKPLISFPNLAPRPGLEPGTYGLTVGPEGRSESQSSGVYRTFQGGTE